MPEHRHEEQDDCRKPRQTPSKEPPESVDIDESGCNTATETIAAELMDIKYHSASHPLLSASLEAGYSFIDSLSNRATSLKTEATLQVLSQSITLTSLQVKCRNIAISSSWLTPDTNTQDTHWPLSLTEVYRVCLDHHALSPVENCDHWPGPLSVPNSLDRSFERARPDCQRSSRASWP